MELASCDCFGA